MSTQEVIDDLNRELECLTIASQSIRRTIQLLETIERARQERHTVTGQGKGQCTNTETATAPKDRDGNPIHVGDSIGYLTKVKYPSTEGVVTRFSKNLDRVFSLDNWHKEITQAPRNVRVKPRRTGKS